MFTHNKTFNSECTGTKCEYLQTKKVCLVNRRKSLILCVYIYVFRHISVDNIVRVYHATRSRLGANIEYRVKRVIKISNFHAHKRRRFEILISFRERRTMYGVIE